MGYFEDIRKMVRRIPKGRVATYGDIARAAGYPGTARQVAWALRSPDAVRLPWHRVLGAGGRILLPGEAGLHQRTLLELEGVRFKGARVAMKRHQWLMGSGGGVGIGIRPLKNKRMATNCLERQSRNQRLLEMPRKKAHGEHGNSFATNSTNSHEN